MTTLILGSVAYFYEAIITIPPIFPCHRYISLQWRVRLLTYTPTKPVAPPHRIILPPGHPPSLYQDYDPASYLHRVLHSHERHPYIITLPHLLPSLAFVRSLLTPPPVTPAVLPSPPLPFVCKNIFYNYSDFDGLLHKMVSKEQ